jgi:hypothetical protein
MRALVGLVIALGLLVGSMAGNQTLEDDSKWLEGLNLGVAGRFDGAESQAQERRWGRQRRGTWPPMAGGINT